MKIVRNSSSYRYKLQRKRKRQRLVLLGCVALLVIFLVIFFATRNGGQEAAPVYQTETEPSQLIGNGDVVKMNLNAGDTCMLSLPGGVDVREVSFASDDSNIVRVDAAGRVDALQAGTAKILATGRGYYGVCEFTVAPAPEQTKTAELTTAISANADKAAENAKKGTDDLYNITVNRRTNVVTVYTYDENGDYNIPVRAMVCSCGTGGDDITPTGEYAIYFRELWHPLFGDVYGQYVSGFDGPYLFHSVPYHSEDAGDLKTEEFNKLGTNASQGCVRMMVSDVKWVFENCPMNMPVKVIDADESADPLGKPETIKIDESIAWDPTDPDAKNPYKGKLPTITGADDVTSPLGEAFDPAKGISAKDICGNDITARIRLKGTVITDKPGGYFLTYSLTDQFGQKVEVTRLVVVS